MTKLKDGLDYELYTKSIISEKYKNVWLWKDVPKDILKQFDFLKYNKESCDDIGCDIIAQKHDDTYDFIQCKNYSTNFYDRIF